MDTLDTVRTDYQSLTFPYTRAADQDAPAWLKWIWQRVAARHVFVLALVIFYPLVATPFFTFQIGAQSLTLGLIALSLTFLGGYGGMISLAQMTVAGIATMMLLTNPELRSAPVHAPE